MDVYVNLSVISALSTRMTNWMCYVLSHALYNP